MSRGKLWILNVSAGSGRSFTPAARLQLTSSCIASMQAPEAPESGRVVLEMGCAQVPTRNRRTAISSFIRHVCEQDNPGVELEAGNSYEFFVNGPFSIQLTGYYRVPRTIPPSKPVYPSKEVAPVKFTGHHPPAPSTSQNAPRIAGHHPSPLPPTSQKAQQKAPAEAPRRQSALPASSHKTPLGHRKSTAGPSAGSAAKLSVTGIPHPGGSRQMPRALVAPPTRLQRRSGSSAFAGQQQPLASGKINPYYPQP
ncbi:hypothetical protein FA13DRAFT_1794021 [Coprinellus micaceus]|uniref:Nucleoplasmin-like domain-containing protein n=1 Tax=Coprinellus micaceus TaxID=71717 RepID=A0A4Y7T4P0_COPMI|nr:hypothetical protein FA13DRAFT_1794021 [Coprinellus micaceus]